MATNISRFLAFQQEQGGVLPPKLAASYLGISRQALNDAKTKGRIENMMVSEVTYYGFKALKLYREMRTARHSIAKSFGTA